MKIKTNWAINKKKINLLNYSLVHLHNWNKINLFDTFPPEKKLLLVFHCNNVLCSLWVLIKNIFGSFYCFFISLNFYHYLPLAILLFNNSNNDKLTWFTLISSFRRFASESISSGERDRYFSLSAGDTEFLCRWKEK